MAKLHLCNGMAVFALVCAVVHADTLTWTGNGNGAFWSDPANWSSDGSHTIPQSGDRVIASVNATCNVTNDIEGLSLPYLEMRYNRTNAGDNKNACFYGKQITLTGGLGAFKSATTGSGGSGPRLLNYIPFHLDSGVPGGTNKFTIAQRFHMYANLTGPDYLWVSCTSANMYDCNGTDSRTAGVTLDGTGLIDSSSAKAYGDGTYPFVYRGTSYIRLYADASYWIDIHPASSLGASSATMGTYGNRSFNGRITGERMVFTFLSSGSGVTATFNGAIDIPDGPVHFIRPNDPENVVFNGSLNIGTFGNYYQENRGGSVTFNHENNAIANFYSLVQNSFAGAKNAFGTNAVVRFGTRSNQRGMMDMRGYDQQIDRFELNSSYLIDAANPNGHLITSTAGDARLTLAATANCETDALFGGDITLVWAPKGSYSFCTYAACGRDMPMTGGIVVSNGIFTVNGTNAFPNATSVEVADGAAFVWDSERAFGLRSVTGLTLGEGASFTVRPSAAMPFHTSVFQASMSLNLAPGASLDLPSGTVLPALAVTTGGVTFAVGTVLTGDSGESGAVYLPQLAGTGAKIKVVAPVMEITSISSLAYVQDGLTCHLDAIENAGRGTHDSSAATWKDLSGVAGDFEVTSGITKWREKALGKTGDGYMALNRARGTRVTTLEAAVSGLDTATRNVVMPMYQYDDRSLVIRDMSATSRKIWYRAGTCHETAENPSAATFAVTYGGTYILYQNGVEPEGVAGESNSWSQNNNPTDSMSVGGRAINWASDDTSAYAYNVHAIRMYNRVLTPEEVWHNYELDSIRFHGVVPEGAVNYRGDPQDPDIFYCKLTASIAGGAISVDGGEAAMTATAWPMLGDAVVLTAMCDAYHQFVEWSGDTNAIIDGTVSSLAVTVRVDRALSFAAKTTSDMLVVTEDTRLTSDVGCRGIRFTGPWTLSAADGVKVTVDEFGEGITVDEGTSGTAKITCPIVIGALAAGDEQTITVPSGATLEISGTFGGLAPLCISGLGTFKVTGGGAYAGDMVVNIPAVYLTGVFSSTDGMLTISPTSCLHMAGADLGKLLCSDRQNGTLVYCESGTVNYLNGGWRQLAKPSTPTPKFDVPANTELTFGGVFNDSGASGIYPSITGSGTFHVRATTQNNLGCIYMTMKTLNIWNQIFQSRPYYCTLGSSSKAYLRVENAISRMPWKIEGYVDLCGHNQTMGRMSYVSEGSGSSWKCYRTGEIHSDAPATLTVYHDNDASGTGNRGAVVFGGKFTGAASLVKTGAGNDACMSTNHLILAGTSTSTGSVSVVWGVLSFTNSFTWGGANYLGTWPDCASATASEKGILELCHSKALGRWTDVYVGTGGKVRLTAGVNQRVRFLYLPTGEEGAYVRQRIGRYGSSQSSAPAGNQLDAYFEGPGTLTSAGEFDGSLLLFK